MENKVISKEYVEKNYVSKKKIEEVLDKYYEYWNTAGKQKYWNSELVEVLEELLED